MANNEDPWIAPDKLYHVIFCFTLTLLFSTLSILTRHPFLRRHSISIASLLSLAAGTAKEAADHLGYFSSSGASARDAVDDVVGVFLGALLLRLLKSEVRSGSESERKVVSMV